MMFKLLVARSNHPYQHHPLGCSSAAAKCVEVAALHLLFPRRVTRAHHHRTQKVILVWFADEMPRNDLLNIKCNLSVHLKSCNSRTLREMIHLLHIMHDDVSNLLRNHMHTSHSHAPLSRPRTIASLFWLQGMKSG
jgi:hypothetical protein